MSVASPAERQAARIHDRLAAEYLALGHGAGLGKGWKRKMAVRLGILDDRVLAEVRKAALAIRGKRERRATHRYERDPLLVAAASRRCRAENKRLVKIRMSLRAAARIARKAGCWVRSSSDAMGRVSSYYVSMPSGTFAVRVSDHRIPWTMERELRAADRGGFWEAHGNRPQIILDRPRSDTWLRRALTLALANRPIPGCAED